MIEPSESESGSLRNTRLVPVTPNHYPMLYEWSTAPAASFRWRFHGGTPSPEQFNEALWSGVLCQFVVSDERSAAHGLVVCYGADHTNGHAYVGVLGNVHKRVGAAAMVGFIQLLEHVFTHWSFRKLYVDVAEYNLSEFHHALQRHMNLEATLSDYLFHGGRYWDQLTYSLGREHYFESVRPRFLPILNSAEPAAVAS